MTRMPFATLDWLSVVAEFCRFSVSYFLLQLGGVDNLRRASSALTIRQDIVVF